MAIIIQEENKSSNLTTIIIAIIVLAIAGMLVYYFFFAPVPFVEKLDGGEKYQTVSKLSGIKINVQEVTDSSTWKALLRPNPTSVIDTKLPSRRINPFESF